MKKLFLVLGMITCMLAMSACGKAVAEEESAFVLSESEATEWGTQLVESLNEIVVSGTEANYEADPVSSAALTSWNSALTEMGDYQGIVGSSADIDAEGATVSVEIEGTLRNAEVEIAIGPDYALTGVSVNAIYSFGEQMGKAGLNTLMGMGTVFAVLILICLVISCFGYIPKVIDSFTRKEEVKASPVAAPAPVVEVVEEELADDLELVAVIAAAIAASEGAASAEGYQVRSIRRARK